MRKSTTGEDRWLKKKYWHDQFEIGDEVRSVTKGGTESNTWTVWRPCARRATNKLALPEKCVKTKWVKRRVKIGRYATSERKLLRWIQFGLIQWDGIIRCSERTLLGKLEARIRNKAGAIWYETTGFQIIDLFVVCSRLQRNCKSLCRLIQSSTCARYQWTFLDYLMSPISRSRQCSFQ